MDVIAGAWSQMETNREEASYVFERNILPRKLQAWSDEALHCWKLQMASVRSTSACVDKAEEVLQSPAALTSNTKRMGKTRSRADTYRQGAFTGHSGYLGL